jgi:hypothetical protein
LQQLSEAMNPKDPVSVRQYRAATQTFLAQQSKTKDLISNKTID